MQNLILSLEDPRTTNARERDAPSRPRSLANQTVEAQLKGVAGQTDFSGSRGRLVIWMTQAEKDQLQQHLYDEVMDTLAQRSPAHTYASLPHLLFALDSAELKEVRGVPAMEAAVQRVDSLPRRWLASWPPRAAGMTPRAGHHQGSVDERNLTRTGLKSGITAPILTHGIAPGSSLGS